MSEYLISFDLGTGGNKVSLYNSDGNCIAEVFVEYPTTYPRVGWYEQKPADWWKTVVQGTRELLVKAKINPNDVVCLSISGHSLGVVPIDKKGTLLRDSVPIWSDARAKQQAADFFKRFSEEDWYMKTGNGFPPPLYPVFKLMWYRDNEPEIFNHIYKVLGTKDYINFCLTGHIYTDHSYASGSGVYDLSKWSYSAELIEISELPRDIFPDIVPSTQVIGNLTKESAFALGLPTTVKVVAGGVDNSCMALGARNIKEGRIYNSLGSSSWIAITTKEPVLHKRYRPFVFAAVIPDLFNSAVPVFSSGTSFRWVRDQFCKDLIKQAQESRQDVYDLMCAEASRSNPGANGIIFNPNLAGGSAIDESVNVRGAFLGLDLGHTRADIIRAAMEGIAMESRVSLDVLRQLTQVGDEMLVVGGGSRNKLWRQIYADVYQMKIIKTNIDQQCAALGAAALAAVGIGIWKDFNKIDELHSIVDITEPDPNNSQIYNDILPVFLKAGGFLGELGDIMTKINLRF